MRKRLSSRLLSVILTIAICATTVLGCLMTVSAATSCYTFSNAVFAEDDLTQATMDVTFTKNDTLPDGFSAGAFTLTEVDADGEDYLTVKSVVAKTDGVNLVNEGNYYIFDGEGFDSVTFTLTFGFSQGEANTSGKVYKVKLTDVELAYGDGAYFIQDDDNGAIGEISAGCAHSVTGVGQPVATGTDDNAPYGYAVYAQSVCTLCGEQFGYQLIPTADKIGDSDSEGATIQWDGSSKTAPTEGSGTEADPYIISDVAHLAYIAEAGPDVTHGKYYKVADGIKNIVLQAAADAETLINIDSAEEAKTYISGLSKISRWGSSKYDAASAFAGFFDGNGATVYGMGSNGSINVSLFGSIGPKAEFKNLSIKNSFVQTGWYAATLAHTVQGYTLADGTAVAKGTVKIDNCTFANNYINPQSGVNGGTSGNQCIGVILGNYNASATGSGLAVNKVMTYGNITFYEQQQANISPLFGALYSTPAPTAETETEYCELMDCILLDIPGDILASNNSNFKAYQNVQNVYSDSTWVSEYLGKSWYNTNDANTVTKAQMLGSGATTAAPNLAWGSTWLVGAAGELPSLVAPDYVSDTIYWDGTTASSVAEGSGTKEDPYIINTASELAYIVSRPLANYADTDGKYFKVADGIKNIVLQPYAYASDIMALESAAETKAYFESGSGFHTWKIGGWEGTTFCGDIDFNGATVYGAYIKDSASNAALICNVDAGAVISNLTLKNSYFTSAAGNYQVGAIAANTNGVSYGKATTGFIWFNTCTVANNYLYNSSTSHDRSAVIMGASSDIIYIDNCLVYGNDATYGSSVTMPILSSANNSTLVSSAPAIPEGLTVVTDGAETPRYNNMVRNSIILGAKPYDLGQGIGSRFNDPKCYVNVYTDANVATDTFSSGATMTVTDAQIKTISASDALGAAAETAMPNLAWGTDWFTGGIGEYPIQSAYVTVGVANSSNSDFTIAGTNIVYEDDGSFSLNIHYIPAYEGFAPTMYIGDTNCTKLYILDAPVASSKRAEIGDNTAMMFTLEGISAKNIDKLWHPTLVAQQGASLDWGKSAQISVADTARATILGDYDTADKNVAAAVLQYGNASQAALAVTENDYNAGTIDLLEFGSYLTDMGSTSTWYDTKVADNGETGTEADPIIIDTAEEFVYLAKASGNDTAGKYYKVADGIAGFDLSKGDLDYNKGLAANLNKIMAGGKNHAGATPGFQGHFDGNGITVYGAWTNHNSISPYAGLFSCTKGDVSIKNVNVKLASFTATTGVGGIVAYHKRADSGVSTLTIENCSITDSHLELTSTGGWLHGIGAIVGASDNCTSFTDTEDTDGDGNTTETIYVNGAVNVKNCYVELDENYFISNFEQGTQTDTTLRGVHGGVAGNMNTNALAVSNCVVIGIKPYATSSNTGFNDVQHSGLESHFTNVYTTEDVAITNVSLGGTLAARNFTGKVIPLSEAQLTGAAAKENMTALDWNTVWTTTDGYPTFINKDYVAADSGYTIYWDGTTATGISEGSGTKEDPYIINTAAELAYVMSQTRDKYSLTDGKYFKVADGITSIVLQKESKGAEIMALGSAAETKAYFESESDLLTWKIGSWEGTTFCGNIDFNGATVYGIYQVSTYNTGLFSTIDAGAVIRNVAIKNSYMVGNASGKDYQVGALAAVSNGDSYGKAVKGVIWFNGITIANNYLYNNSTSHDRSGVLMASSSDAVYSDNILVYGNDATYGDGVKMPLIGNASNSVPDTAAVPEGLVTKFAGTNSSGQKLHVCALRNSVILGTTPYDPAQGSGSRFNDLNYSYENVYTDADLVNDTFSNGTSASTIKGATQVTDLATLKGDAAQSVVDTLNTANGSTVWYVGTTGDYPGFKEAGALNSGLQALYDGIVLTPDDYANSNPSLFGVYSTSVNLNSNPYMTFVFEFGQEYKTNRDKIAVTFTYTVNGEEKTFTTSPGAFVGDGTINNEGGDGWYNKPSAGRFHTYRFRDIPVEALGGDIKVSASYNGGDAVNFGTFSVSGLAYEFDLANKQTPSNYYATRIEAAKALLFYTQMIKARYGA